MPDGTLPEEWAILRQWLPDDLEARARQHGFIRRARGLTDPELWLRMILMHVAGGLSLEQTVVRARELGLAQVSHVALFKRLLGAEAWLRDLSQHLLEEQRRRLGVGEWPRQYHVRAVDATDVLEPGSGGTSWRIHYSIRLPELVCDHYELTNAREGEKLARFRFDPRDLVIADRGYSTRAGVAHVREAGSQLLLRWNPGGLPVTTATGDDFELLRELGRLPVCGAREWQVRVEHDGRSYPLRLCALRKSRLASERSRRKKLRKAQRNGTEPCEVSLALTEFVLVLTSLPKGEFPTSAVLELYRSRWQVELSFKRLKSLLGAGHVPKSNDRSARAWMQAKILSSLLLERLLIEAKAFSPWGFKLRRDQPLAAVDRGA